MKKGRNSGDKEGDALWAHVTRGVRPYAARSVTAVPAPPASGEKKVQRRAPAPTPAPRKGSEGKGFDRATETKMRKGRLPLEGTLDLHGMTQERAFAALLRFVRAAVAQEKRTLLVITGKGARGEGVLRRLLPLWLEEEPFLKSHRLALTPAQPKDGGSGAFYLRLRKPLHR